MNPDAFATWLANAKPGETIEYYRGALAEQCDIGSSSLNDRARSFLLALRKLAMNAADTGNVHLVQRKCGWNDYAYLAVAR